MKKIVYSVLFLGLFSASVQAESCNYSSFSLTVKNATDHTLSLEPNYGLNTTTGEQASAGIKIPSASSYTYSVCGTEKSTDNFKVGVSVGGYKIYLDHGFASPDLRMISSQQQAIPAVKLTTASQSAYWWVIFGSGSINYHVQPSLNCSKKSCSTSASVEIQS
jgi:hypothetical protein